MTEHWLIYSREHNALPILEAFRDREAEAEFAAQQERALAKGESNA